jgi:6-phosphogluconolactonase
MTIKIFPTPFKLAERFAEELIRMVKESADKRRTFTIALSGGSTPKLLFSVLGERFLNSVPPDNSDSNFGMTDKVFLEKIKIPPENIHRIKGEKDPEEEAVRYSDEIARFTGERGGLPLFDLIILGLGEDGHTASIFPGNNMLLNSEKICDIAIHPLSFQKRITITGNVINNAENVIFLVTGAHKAKVVSDIIERRGTVDYPAAHIEPQQGILQWYLDDAAAKMIDKRTLIDFRYK